MDKTRGTQGQITVEYFLLLATLAAVTIVAVTTFDEDIRAIMVGLFQAADVLWDY